MSSSIFGWDLLIRSIESEINNNEDVLLCFTHLILVANEFKCIGLGESKVFDGTEPKSEALPTGWSKTYALRYVHQGRLYLLKATKVDEGLMMNLIRVDERNTSMVQLNSNLVATRSGNLDQTIPKHADVVQQIKTQLIEPIVVSKNNRDSSSQTTTRTPATQPNYSPYGVPPSRGLIDYDDHHGLGAGVGVGELDLHPFGRNPMRMPGPAGGGGMLFIPPNSGRYPQAPGFLPPGAVPPGARFDPYRPPDVDRFPRRPPNRPDNDEFPPPGYDDMFM